MSTLSFLPEIGTALSTRASAMTLTERIIAGLCVTCALYSFIRLWFVIEQETRVKYLSRVQRALARTSPVTSNLDKKAVDHHAWYDRLGAWVATTTLVGATDYARLARALANAGFRGGKYRVATLIAIKVALGLGAALAMWSGLALVDRLPHNLPLLVLILLGPALLAWRVPDVLLAWLATRRRQRIDQRLPDALDLLVISAEAGLSLEQSIDFVARKMEQAGPEVSEELLITAAELRVLGDRRQALQNFADRIDLPAARGLGVTLNQALRYGTPLAQSLRVLAAEMRNARLLRIEAKAARMPVLMTLPLMVFILPSLVIVCAGPAILKAIDAFGTLAK